MEDERKSILSDIERTLFYRGSQVGVGQNEVDKATNALVKTFIPEHSSGGFSAFKGLREAYIYFTGDDEMRGKVAGFRASKVSSGLRGCADFNSSTFTYALRNALNMYLSKIYKSFPYHEEIFISEIKTVADFRKITSLQLAYPGDLPDVDPEAGDYESLEEYTDTESQYSLEHKGGITWITRKQIINDSVGLVQAMIGRRARSARRTHAKFVWSFFINNSNCPDGTAWFTAPHGNLGSSALNFDPLSSAVTALANMEEPGSGEKLGMDLASFNWNLVIPIPLWKLAISKNQAKYYYTSDDLTAKTENPNCRLFGDHNERIIVCPFISDPNDWGVVRDKSDVPIVEMSYLNGRQEPEFILADTPSAERNFRSDDYGYKIRYEYGGTLAGSQGGYKSIVA